MEKEGKYEEDDEKISSFYTAAATRIRTRRRTRVRSKKKMDSRTEKEENKINKNKEFTFNLKFIGELLYCRCDDIEANGEHPTAVARACSAMMGALRPACSVVELPPPNCADVLQRCLADSHCRFV